MQIGVFSRVLRVCFRVLGCVFALLGGVLAFWGVVVMMMVNYSFEPPPC